MIEVPRRARTGERFAAAEAECKYGVSPAAEICGVYSGAERLFMLGRGNRAEWGREEGNEGKEEDGNEREREGENSSSDPLLPSFHFLSASLLQSISSLPLFPPLAPAPLSLLWLPFGQLVWSPSLSLLL